MGWYEKVQEGGLKKQDGDPDATDPDADGLEPNDPLTSGNSGLQVGSGRRVPRPLRPIVDPDAPDVGSPADAPGDERSTRAGGAGSTVGDAHAAGGAQPTAAASGPAAGAAGASVASGSSSALRSIRPRSRFRTILPKSVLGFAAVVFFMGMASALTGAVLYAYYESRLERTENAVDAFVGGFTEQLEAGKQIIAAAGEEARGQVQQQLRELEKFAASGGSLSSVLEKVVPSVWFVQTLDEAGQPSVGSAFVVFADSDQSFLLTSYNTIRAATVEPGPAIVIRKGDQELRATLHSWDQPRDLAVLVVDKGEIPALTWASDDPPAQVGDRVFIISGLGASGGSISQGFVADVSASGLQHDAPVGAAYQGGPLLNTNGEVIGVSSRVYAPLGFDPLAVFFSPPIKSACQEVLRCPDGKPAP